MATPAIPDEYVPVYGMRNLTRVMYISVYDIPGLWGGYD